MCWLSTRGPSAEWLLNYSASISKWPATDLGILKSESGTDGAPARAVAQHLQEGRLQNATATETTNDSLWPYAAAQLPLHRIPLPRCFTNVFARR